MIIETKKFKDVCATILSAIDTSELSTLTETLELHTEGKILFLNVTNGEYYVSKKIEIESDESFVAAVNANLFLKLIAAVTTEDVELEMKDTYIQVKANGTYRIPLIFDGDSIMSLPKININNKTAEMKISGDTLNSILDFNSKELSRGVIAKPIQKMFYLDDKGCITFTTGACVNSFTLEKPIKILMNGRLVRLFKLFKGEMVDFVLGYDPVSDDVIQTKVSFTTPSISLTAITGSNDDLLSSFPVDAIRKRAFDIYPDNIVLNTQEFRQAIDRLLLFTVGYGSIKVSKPYGEFDITSEGITIYDSNKENKETIKFKNDSSISDEYSMTLDLTDLKLILSTISDQYITLSFGNHQAVVLKRLNISNIIPEVKTL